MRGERILVESFAEMIRRFWQPMGAPKHDADTALQDGMRDYFIQQAKLSDSAIEKQIDPVFDFRKMS